MNDEVKEFLVDLGLSGGAVGLFACVVAWWRRNKPTLVLRPGEFRITWQSGARPGP